MRHPDEQFPFDRHLVEELAAVQELADKLPPGPDKDAGFARLATADLTVRKIVEFQKHNSVV